MRYLGLRTTDGPGRIARRVAQPRRVREAGSSLVETLVLGLGLLVPLSISIASMANAQRTALAVAVSAREAARAASVASDSQQAWAVATRVVSETLVASGLEPSVATVTLEGDFRRGGHVGVSVSYPVRISFAGIFDAAIPVRLVSKSRFGIGIHRPL